MPSWSSTVGSAKASDPYLAALQRISSSHFSSSVTQNVYERALQFMFSEWWCRLWTLQEGVLARSLFVQFADGALAPDQLVPDEYLDPCTDEGPRDWTDLGAFLRLNLDDRFRLRESFIAEAPNATKPELETIADAFANRSVTKAMDEAICISTLLNIDTSDLRDRTAPTMDYIYRKVELPQDLLFGSGVRLSEPGFRWAPKSFLNQEVSSSFGRLKGTLSPRGFTVVKNAVLLREDFKFSYGKTLSRGGNWSVGTKPDTYFGAIQPSRQPYNTEEQLRDRVLKSPALIIRDQEGSRVGVLVSDARREGDIWYARYEVKVWYFTPDEFLEYYGGREANLPPMQHVLGDFHKPEIWCVD